MSSVSQVGEAYASKRQSLLNFSNVQAESSPVRSATTSATFGPYRSTLSGPGAGENGMWMETNTWIFCWETVLCC